MEKPEEIKHCQNCKYFKQPKCNLTDKFKARKTNGCGQYKFDGKQKIQTIKKIKKVKKTDADLKREILGEDKIFKDAPFERPKIKQSQRRK